MKIAHELVPHGGWIFEIGIYKIKGNSFDDLVQNVRAHMISNRIEFGNLEKDIEDQIAERFPELVIKHSN